MRSRPPTASSAYQAQERRSALLMMLPATLLLGLFLITPFFMAFYLSLTDQRLISPRPAEFVGLDNYRRLLTLKFITMEPLRDEATGAVQRDADGDVEYPRARTLLRGTPAYEDLREVRQLNLFGKHILIAAGDPVFVHSLLNNIYFTLVVVPVQTSFALLLALLVNQKIRGANLFRTIYFSPVVTTMAVISVLWFFLYNPSEGLINAMLGVFGIEPLRWLQDRTTAMPAIMLLSIWQGVGFQMVIYLAGLQNIPESLYEASALDGANLWQQFRHVTLPGLRNTTIFIAISSTILAFKLYTQVEIMTFGMGGPENSTTTMILHLVNQGFKEQRVGYASAVAVVFVLLVVTIGLAQRYVFARGEGADA